MRNAKIEFLRIIAMLLIVTCHAMNQFTDWHIMTETGWKSSITWVISQNGQIGVALFFCITGFFLYKKKQFVKNISSTWIQVCIYSVLFCFIYLIIHFYFNKSNPQVDWLLQGSNFYRQLIRQSFLPVLSNHYWFVTSYILLLFFAPFINCLITQLSRADFKKLLLLIALIHVAFVFGLHIADWSSLLYAIFCYLLGAYINIYKPFYTFSLARVISLIILMELLMLIFNYLSMNVFFFKAYLEWEAIHNTGLRLCQIFVAVLLLSYCSYKQNNLNTSKSKISYIICVIASSTFGVYLIHENVVVREYLKFYIRLYFPVPDNFYVAMITLLFISLMMYIILSFVSLFIDRCLVKPIQKIFNVKLLKQ